MDSIYVLGRNAGNKLASLVAALVWNSAHLLTDLLTSLELLAL